jgi:hypothetical protein
MIAIAITSNARQIAENIRDLNERGIGAAIAAAMDFQNQQTKTHIEDERLTGEGPFPPSEHKLGVRSGLLRRSLRATPARVTGRTVTSAIGTNIFYAAIHEFGGSFQRKATGGITRLRADAKGNLLRNGRGGAIFAKKEHKRVAERAFTFKSRTIKFPERAPIRTGIEDCVPSYGGAISAAIEDAWNNGGKR